MAQAKVGVHVVDLHTGQQLYARDAEALYNPASNMKLITSAAAIDLFGPAHTFSTTLRAERVEGSVIPGDLYLEGTGEGFLLYEDVLDWGSSLRQQGIERVEGDLVVGDGPFQGGEYLPPGFEQKQEDASYRSAIGAVSVNFNAVTVRVEPGASIGDAVRVTLDPPNDYVTLQVTAKTISGKSDRVAIASEPKDQGEGTIIRVEGSLGASAKAKSARKRIDNPPRFAGSVLKGALETMGIEVKGGVRAGERPRGASVELVSHGSEPLPELLMAMNKWSNNFMAEQLFRALGTHASAGAERGSWAGSAAVLRAFLESVGLKPDVDFTIKNGSGLYDGNGLSPSAITRVLAHMDAHRWGVEYIASLAIGGVDGTLAGRFKGPHAGAIRGKTGTLNEVSALSGYVNTKGGRRLAVSILINDPPRFAWTYRAQQDAIAEALIDFER